MRRGKWVVVTLAGTVGIIVIQPRMTGGFWLTKPDRPDHIRLVFHVEKPRAMVWFCDTRRLGKIGWYRRCRRGRARRSPGRTGRMRSRSAATSCGDRLKRTARGIKPTLMDQKVLAGIGNIYADEILHRARESIPSGSLHALDRRARTAASGDRRRSGDGDRGWRDRASTPAIGRSWAWRGASWLKTRSTAGRPSLPGLLRADREDKDRRPDRPTDLFLPALPEAVKEGVQLIGEFSASQPADASLSGEQRVDFVYG